MRTWWFVGLTACAVARDLGDIAADDDATGDEAPSGLPWSDDGCDRVPADAGTWIPDIARFVAQDDAAAPPEGHVVAVGSSSIRRWETATRVLAPWGVVQRGVGGIRLLDVAAATDDLVARHAPAAVVLFAGTNDIALGATVDEVTAAYRCFVTRVHATAEVPIVFVGITPTPSRWAQWDDASAVNDAIAAWSDAHPLLAYADVPAPFLAQGSPPPASLFVGDQLHLSDAGYALWDEVIAGTLEGLVPHRADAAVGQGPAGGAYVRVDLGPTDGVDGRAAPSPDAFGNHWNAWPGRSGSEPVWAGEALRGLVDTKGRATGLDLVVAGGFRVNGRRNGGLLDPPGETLQTMAVPEATEDFAYSGSADDPMAFTITGLDPGAGVVVRFFASRADTAERRVSRYVVEGEGASQTATLLTTGPDIGADGYDGNDDTVAVTQAVTADRWGQLHLDVEREEGAYAYLSVVELELP